MATSTDKTRCAKCGKEKSTLRCNGCLENFCFNHLMNHRQELNRQLDEIQVNRDVFRQSLNEQTKGPSDHPSMQQINIWERDSIKKIEKTAEEARQLLVNRIAVHFNQIEQKLDRLTVQLKEVREENDLNEINLRQFQQELTRLTAELNNPPNISVRQRPSTFIDNIDVVVSAYRITALAPVIMTENQSTANMENTHKLATLMDELNDQSAEYARRRIEQISEELTTAIGKIIVDTQAQQQGPLVDATLRSAAIEEEYKLGLQKYVEEHDAVRATNLSKAEKDLSLRQEMILEQGRKRINDLNEEGNRLKLGVFREAQAQTNARVNAQKN